MTEPKFPKPLAAAASLVGVALWTYFYFVSPGKFPSATALVMFSLALVPYAICLALTFRRPAHPYFGFFGSMGALVGDGVILYPIVISPTSSTSALGILAVPFHNLFLFVPAAMLVAYLLQGVWGRARTP